MSCSPVRLDLDRTAISGPPVMKTRPPPVSRTFAESACDWVAVNITPLFQTRLLGENVEVIVARLPKGALSRLGRYRQFQRLNRPGQQDPSRLTHQQVDVFGHHNIRGDEETIASAHGFKRTLEEFAGGWGFEVRQALVAGESEEVKFSGLLIPCKISRHLGEIVALLMVDCLRKRRTGELIRPCPNNRDMGHPPLS